MASAARARSLTVQTAQKAKQAKLELVVVVPLLAATVFVYLRRQELLGVDEPVRIGAVGADGDPRLGARARHRPLRRAGAVHARMDPATAGTVSFLIRLVMIAVAALLALRVAGLDPRTLAVGGAITAVVIGLAAQQTLGNLIAGMVLIAARPFRVGDRVRLQAGAVAGQIEGVVALARAALHDVRAGPGLDHGPQQRRARRRGRAAARARRRRPARAAAPRRQAQRLQALLEDERPHARPRRAAHRAGGDRLATRSSSGSPPRPSPRPTARAWPTRSWRPWPRSTRRATSAARRRALRSRRRRAALALGALRLGDLRRRSRRRMQRWPAARPARRRAKTARRASPSGATSTSAPVALDRAQHAGARPARASWCRRSAGSLTPESWNMPRVADEAGEARPRRRRRCRAGPRAAPSAKPRRPNLVAE